MSSQEIGPAPKIPSGFALRIAEANATGWGWHGWSYRGTVVSMPTVDGRQVRTERPAVHTVMIFWWHPAAERTMRRTLFMHWVDGKFVTARHRHPDDPVPTTIGSRALGPLLTGTTPAARWTRPDLERDEGTPAHERWAPDIETRVQAGMDRLKEYERSREKRPT